MTRLPFTLATLLGEPFGLWWYTYGLRLGVTHAELAHATSTPAEMPPGPEHAATIATPAGLATSEVARRFTISRPRTPEHVSRAWTPRPCSRLRPGCLADGTSLQHAWAPPLSFDCLLHDRRLAEFCAGCDQAAPSRRTPATPLTESSCPFCDHNLTAVQHQSGQHREATAAGRKLISTALARLRDPVADDEREQAQDNLTDLTLIALHSTQDDVAAQRSFDHRLPDATAVTTAVSILTTPPPTSEQDPLSEKRLRCPNATVPSDNRSTSAADSRRTDRQEASSNRQLHRIPTRADHGAVSAELVIAIPLLLLLLLTIVQFALWSHATHIAQAAASQGLAAARADGGTAAAGTASAQHLLDQLAEGPLTGTSITCTRTTEVASIHISGTATPVIPFLNLRVHAEATGPVERFVPDQSGR